MRENGVTSDGRRMGSEHHRSDRPHSRLPEEEVPNQRTSPPSSVVGSPCFNPVVAPKSTRKLQS